MTALSRFMACAAALCLGTATPAAADPVQITAGSVTAFWQGVASGGLAPTDISGTNGFSLIGNALPGEGFLDIFDNVTCADCIPGSIKPATTHGLDGFLGTFDATATFEGKTYEITQSVDSPTVVGLLISGTAVIPPFEERQRVATGAFTVTGGFFSQFGPISEKLAGAGTATLFLSPVHPLGTNAWRVDQIRYEFGAGTVPEPATLMLTGLGLIAAGYRSRSRLARL